MKLPHGSADMAPRTRRLQRRRPISKRANITKDLPKRLNTVRSINKPRRGVAPGWNKFLNYTKRKLRWMRNARQMMSHAPKWLEGWLRRLRNRMKAKVATYDYNRAQARKKK